MSKLKFYWPYSPTAREDAQKIANMDLQHKLSFLKERLKTITYWEANRNDPMESPDVLFATGHGDCEDMCAYIFTVLCMTNTPNTAFVGRVEDPDMKTPEGHVWIEVDNYIFETTIPDILTKSEQSIKYFPYEYVYCTKKGEIIAR